MGNLPRTLIFVLSASLIVALVYLPVVGGVAGRLSRALENSSKRMRAKLHWTLRLLIALASAAALLYGLFALVVQPMPMRLIGALIVIFAGMELSIAANSFRRGGLEPVKKAGYRRTLFGRFIHLIAGNWVMPLVAIALTVGFVVYVFDYFGENSKGVEFFVETDPEQAILFVRARGNLSLNEKDRLVREVEEKMLGFDEVASVHHRPNPVRAGGLDPTSPRQRDHSRNQSRGRLYSRHSDRSARNRARPGTGQADQSAHSGRGLGGHERGHADCQ